MGNRQDYFCFPTVVAREIAAKVGLVVEEYRMPVVPVESLIEICKRKNNNQYSPVGYYFDRCREDLQLRGWMGFL